MVLKMEEFNINELAGATGLILGAVSGILVVIFKSRCYCKFRVGCSDKFNLCMCERKPPPDVKDSEEEDNDKSNQKDKNKSKDSTTQKKIDRTSKEKQKEPEPEPEPEIENLL